MSCLINPYVFASAGGVPSTSEIIITANAEIEAANTDILSFSGSFASGVAGAHGRVYDNGTFIAAYTYPGGEEEYVSAGMRFYVRTDAADDLLRFRDSVSANHLRVRRHTDDTWNVVNNGGTALVSGTTVLSTLTWFYVALYARIHSTLGEIVAKLYDASGALLETLTASGIDTQNGATALAAITAWGGASADTYVDHLWTDLTGAFRGPAYVETRSPISNGDANNWTRGGTDTGANWDQVDEVPKNTTSYVFSTGADQVELYNFQDRAQAGTPVTVQQIIYAHAHTAGTREYKPICKIGGTIYEGATQSTTSTSTGTAPVVYNWQNNPATGGAWTDSDIDSAQFGVKSVTTDVRLQCIALHVLVQL